MICQSKRDEFTASNKREQPVSMQQGGIFIKGSTVVKGQTRDIMLEIDTAKLGKIVSAYIKNPVAHLDAEQYGTFERHDPLMVLEAAPIKPGLLQKIKAKWLSLFEKDGNK